MSAVTLDTVVNATSHRTEKSKYLNDNRLSFCGIDATGKIKIDCVFVQLESEYIKTFTESNGFFFLKLSFPRQTLTAVQ